LWGFNSVYVINSNEIGVVTLFGKPKEQTSAEGLHFLLWPVEQVERVPRTENQIIIGTTSSARTGQENGLMLSGDSNIADVQFSVLWQVQDPVKFLYNVREPEDLVRRTAESAMREVVGRRPVQDIFRDDQAGILAEVQTITQEVLERYGAGVTINQVTFDNAQPPKEVADAFNDVQRAEQDEDRLQEEARTYSNTLLGNARGEAAKIREDAAAYKQQVTLEAEGEAARFVSVYNEYVNNPDVTRKRLYLETMEQVLGGANKVIMEPGATGSGVVPYLPLPEVQSRATTGAATLGVTKP
jgi:membrane protease subunit HflK